MITTEQIHSTFMSARWREAADELGTAFGVTVSVVDTASGATLSAGGAPCACSAMFGGEPMAGLGCIGSMGRDVDPEDPDPVQGGCASGLRVSIAPVRFEGETVCHVMLCGFVTSAQERQAVSKRLRAAGIDASEAQTVAEQLPSFDRDRATAATRTVVARAEAMLKARASVDVRAARGAEMAMLAEVTADPGLSDLTYGRVPEGPLRSLVRLTGSDAAIAQIAAPSGCETRPTTHVGEELAAEVAALVDSANAQVRDTGRPLISTGADGSGHRVSILAVALDSRDPRAGVLTLVKSGGEPLGADDMRVAGLFADTIGAMRATAQDAVDANTKLVELVQVNEVARLLNSTLDGDRLAELVVEVLSKTLVFDVGGFVVDGFSQRNGSIVHTTDVSLPELEALVADAWGTDPDPRLLRGVDIRSRAAVLSPEPRKEPREWSLLAHELRFRNVRAGQIFIASLTPEAFCGGDDRVLGALAAHLSIALENAAVYTRLSEDFKRAIAALSALADATERLDRGHTDRVMDYAVSLGEEMELSIDRIGLLRFAGLLHDLGKVGIAEEILVKPSLLTEEEMALVRQHSEMGATIVEQVQVLEALTPIVRHHHEHWDGSGYPDGLSGEQIPLEARILAVADAYEAMTGTRPHRKRLPAAAARIEIERGAGTQFDPDVARAFLSLLDRRALAGATGGYAEAVTRRPEPPLPS